MNMSEHSEITEYYAFVDKEERWCLKQAFTSVIAAKTLPGL